MKRARQAEARRRRNASIKSRTKTEGKKVLLAIEGGDVALAKELLSQAVPLIAKAAAKGVIHKRTAARKISRLTKRFNALAGRAQL
mgnify:CR=1 FL=1